MKINVWIFSALFAIVCFATLMAFQSPKSLQSMNYDSYEERWKKVDSLENQGLVRSALVEVNEILATARKDNNSPQLVKSLLFKSRYISQVEENGFYQAFEDLEAEIKAQAGPTKAILHALAGGFYLEYLSSNYWRLQSRTSTGEEQSEDFQTWSADQLAKHALQHLVEAPKEPSLKKIPIDDYQAIIEEGVDTKGLRPTLYDLLAHRSLSLLSNDHSYLNDPAYRFYLEQDEIFADARSFVQLDFQTQDSLSFKYHAVLLYQDLLRFRLKADEPAALLDADLQRLRFVYQNSVAANSKELYVKALERLLEEYADLPASAEVAGYLAGYYQQEGQNYQPNPDQEDPKRWYFKKAHEICTASLEKWPNASENQMCQNTKVQIEAALLSFEMELVNVPGQPFLVSLQYCNMPKAHLRLIQMNDKRMDEFQKARQVNSNEALAYLRNLPALRSWTEEFPAETDFRPHRTEIALEALPTGTYLLLASSEADFGKATTPITGYAVTNCSNLGYWNRMGEGLQQEFVVYDRQTGQPLEGVAASAYFRKYNSITRSYNEKLLAKGQSDEHGFIKMDLGKDRSYFRLQLIHNRDTLYLENGFSSSQSAREYKEQLETQFFLDRAIYRPGQTVYFKGVVLKKDKERMPSIVSGKKVEVTFYDVNNQKVTSAAFTTNEYGTFSGSFTAPTGGLLGGMRLVASIGGQQYLRVEEYKRPKFEVTFDEMEEAFQLNDKVEVKGKAMAYAGNAIDGATVQYRVVREARFPWLPWWFYRPAYYGNSQEIATGTVTTDADGAFAIPFTALPDRSIPAEQKPEFNFTVYADVTDITGETQSDKAYVTVGYIALNASINLPDQIEADSFSTIPIQTTNLDGGFEPAKGSITVQLLNRPRSVFIDRFWEQPDRWTISEERYRKQFPHFAYKGEDNAKNWEVSRVVLDAAFDTEVNKMVPLGKARLVPGTYKITLNTQDKYGKAVSLERLVNVYDLSAKNLPVPVPGWILPPAMVLQPGDQAQFTIASSLPKQPFLFEIEHQGAIVQSKWVQANEPQQLTFNIEEKHRGGLQYHISYAGLNRSKNQWGTIQVPWSNKDLQIEYTTFRDKLLPGQQEEWQIKLKGPKGEKVAAEMLAAMYDASLDAFAPNNWAFSPFPLYGYAQRSWGSNGYTMVNPYYLTQPMLNYHYYSGRSYPALKTFGFSGYDQMLVARSTAMMLESNAASDVRVRGQQPKMADAPPPPPPSVQEEAAYSIAADSAAPGVPTTYDAGRGEAEPVQEQEADLTTDEIPVRTNLNETVFFFPELSTDAEGHVVLKFTMNEALTKWKFQAFGHTKALESVISTKSVITQKDLMVVPNPPRFYREGDEIEFTSKVVNLTEQSMSGTAQLQLVNPLTDEPVFDWKKDKSFDRTFVVDGGQSIVLSWRFKVPNLATVPVIEHTVFAKAGDFTDAEREAKPVISNRMSVTETMPLPLAGKSTKTFEFNRLKDASSSTLSHQNLTLEFTANPAWYAVQALPYLMEYPYECTEQIFNRYYANALAGAVANSHPKIQKVFEQWRGTDALKSNLTKNQELKSALLEETPWVLQAQSESEQKARIALLFDLNRMAQEERTALKKISDRQLPGGGFAWFPGGRDSWYVTQYLIEGLGHLDYLGVTSIQEDPNTWRMVENAVQYLDRRVEAYYDELAARVKAGQAKWDDDHLDPLIVHYLYTRSFFLIDRSAQASKDGVLNLTGKDHKNIPLQGKITEIVAYYKGQADKYWLSRNVYQQGMLALALHRIKGSELPAKITASLKERALYNEELGMYWKYPSGYFWYQLPIETHSLMIELFEEVAQDAKAVYDLKVWLLKNKQTSHWKTTKATAAAVYALLMSGENWLLESQPLDIQLGKRKDKLAEQWNQQVEQAQAGAEAGTGYFKTSFGAGAIDNSMATITVQNPNASIAWGAVYWQYFEQLDKITSFEETPLELKKALYKVTVGPKGEELTRLAEGAQLNPGDKIKVRIELRVDRPMEYVHMKDMRASGFEPINVISGYKWQGGLGYYESTRDVSTNFFFSYLPVGTHVFEYPLRVVHKGDFSNGITTIQCMYAPEFTSHSEGVRVVVE